MRCCVCFSICGVAATKHKQWLWAIVFVRKVAKKTTTKITASLFAIKRKTGLTEGFIDEREENLTQNKSCWSKKRQNFSCLMWRQINKHKKQPKHPKQTKHVLLTCSLHESRHANLMKRTGQNASVWHVLYMKSKHANLMISGRKHPWISQSRSTCCLHLTQVFSQTRGNLSPLGATKTSTSQIFVKKLFKFYSVVASIGVLLIVWGNSLGHLLLHF